MISEAEVEADSKKGAKRILSKELMKNFFPQCEKILQKNMDFMADEGQKKENEKKMKKMEMIEKESQEMRDKMQNFKDQVMYGDDEIDQENGKKIYKGK